MLSAFFVCVSKIQKYTIVGASVWDILQYQLHYCVVSFGISSLRMKLCFAEKAMIEEQIRVAEAARMRAEAELKIQREREREAARNALEKVSANQFYMVSLYMSLIIRCQKRWKCIGQGKKMSNSCFRILNFPQLL